MDLHDLTTEINKRQNELEQLLYTREIMLDLDQMSDLQVIRFNGFSYVDAYESEVSECLHGLKEVIDFRWIFRRN